MKNKIKGIIHILLFSLPVMGCATLNHNSLKIIEPMVEMQKNPSGISELSPRFSWKLLTGRMNITQIGYQIEVAESKKDILNNTDLLWNSGRMNSSQSWLVKYAGKKLESGKRYYWRVTVWDNARHKAKSEIQEWTMALLKNSDWKACWIGLNDNSNVKLDGERTILPARYLRKEFNLKLRPKRAVLHVSGIGSSTCYLNGKRIGNDVFGPLPTWYDASVPYLTYDVTPLLNSGSNAVGVILGNGRYFTMRHKSMIGFGLPRLKAQLDIEYENGEKHTIISDNSWKVTNKGPITANNEFDGEIYDERLDLGKWTECGYDDSAWDWAEQMTSPKGKLTAQLSPSLKVMEEIKPVSVKSVGQGRYIIDMGQNMVGIQQVKLVGKKGKPIKMRFSEVLEENGTDLYVDNLRDARVTDVYIPNKDGEFIWEPLFVYHGFRFMEISGIDYVPTVDDFIGKVVYDKMRTIGSFETSNQLLNQLYKNAYWGIRGNYRGMPTDCPQRDERVGWLGDRTTGAHGESFIFDNALLYKKWLVDIEESMNENGSISVISPRYWSVFHDDVTWPAAYFYIAYMVYQQFGDDSSIKRHYHSMKRWVKHMASTKMRDYIMIKDVYGDWCMPPESPELIHSQDPNRKTNGQLLSTAFFYSILQLMEKFALLNNRPTDADKYSALAKKMKDTYNDKFFKYEAGQYDNNTVTANLLSLRFGLVPEGYENKVIANVVNKTKNECNGHVSTGVIGIQHLMRGLSEYGGLELAYKIATNETYPSWGYMIKKGATTIWELWNGDTADPAMNSRNHVMLLGDLLIWFYENLAGIKNHPDSVGFKQILMEPQFPVDLKFVKASYVSPYGEIKSCWKRNKNKLEWHIEIPANTTATIKLPLEYQIYVNPKQTGIHSVKESGSKLEIKLGSGKYKFKSR